MLHETSYPNHYHHKWEYKCHLLNYVIIFELLFQTKIQESLTNITPHLFICYIQIIGTSHPTHILQFTFSFTPISMETISYYVDKILHTQHASKIWMFVKACGMSKNKNQVNKIKTVKSKNTSGLFTNERLLVDMNFIPNDLVTFVTTCKCTTFVLAIPSNSTSVSRNISS